MEITNFPAFIGGLGGTEVFLILFVILLLFGSKHIPELAKCLALLLKAAASVKESQCYDKLSDFKEVAVAGNLFPHRMRR